MEKMKVLEVKFSEWHKCFILLCTNGEKTLYAPAVQSLSAREGDMVLVLNDKGLKYRGHHAVAIMPA